MTRALTALLDGVIDYAGLFPPARLEMPLAVNEFLALRNGPHAWMVDRFACTVSRLGELADELEKHELEEAIGIAAIGAVAPDLKHLETSARHDAELLEKFRLRIGQLAVVESYEVRIPENHHVEACLGAVDPVEVEEIFLELPFAEGLDTAISTIAGSEYAMAKARLGGVNSKEDFPSAESVAAFIQGCAQLDLPFKLTAGLHHPFPVDDPLTGGRMHGFLNVLIATAMAMQHDFSRRELEELLVSPAEAFCFGETTISFGDAILKLDQLEETRDLFTSFGSCSVEEPVEDLAKLGLA